LSARKFTSDDHAAADIGAQQDVLSFPKKSGAWSLIADV
jgi:hypothetical protein